MVTTNNPFNEVSSMENMKAYDEAKIKLDNKQA